MEQNEVEKAYRKTLSGELEELEWHSNKLGADIRKRFGIPESDPKPKQKGSRLTGALAIIAWVMGLAAFCTTLFINGSPDAIKILFGGYLIFSALTAYMALNDDWNEH